jgi:hypothetical protein
VKPSPIDDYLPLAEVVEALSRRRPDLHVVVTGRNAKPELIAIQLELDPLLRLHPGGEVMLDDRHLGHEVGGGDQPRAASLSGGVLVISQPLRRVGGWGFFSKVPGPPTAAGRHRQSAPFS